MDKSNSPDMHDTIDTTHITLKTLRDELKLKIHLGTMDMQTTFAELEKKAEHLAAELSSASRQAVTELADQMRDLLAKIRK